MRSVKGERGLKRVSNHNKGNGDVIFRHKEPPERLHQVERVRHVLKHHLMLLATQYTPLRSQAPEVDGFWRSTVQRVLIGPHKTVVGVRGVDHTKSPAWTVYWSCYEVILTDVRVRKGYFQVVVCLSFKTILLGQNLKIKMSFKVEFIYFHVHQGRFHVKDFGPGLVLKQKQNAPRDGANFKHVSMMLGC